MGRLSTDYRSLLQSLLPLGGAWSRALASRLAEYFYGQSDELARVDNRSYALRRERIALQTTELIGDLEDELGLPDECSIAASLVLDERRTIAHNKLVSVGQQDKQYFIDIVARFGFDATIDEFGKFICGLGTCGDIIGGSDNSFLWRINITNVDTPIEFLCGEGVCGDPLVKFSDLLNLAFCTVQKFKPAHTQVILKVVGPAFTIGFSKGFDALPSDAEDYLQGGFSKGFSPGFDVNLGGGFKSGSFTSGFDLPA